MKQFGALGVLPPPPFRFRLLSIYTQSLSRAHMGHIYAPPVEFLFDSLIPLRPALPYDIQTRVVPSFHIILPIWCE